MKLDPAKHRVFFCINKITVLNYKEFQMALWGKSENLGAIGPTSVTVVGTASSDFWTAAALGISTVPTGTTILLDNGVEGFVVVESALSADLVRVGKMSGVGTDVNQAYSATYCDQPLYLKNDPGYAESSADGSLGRTQRPVGLGTVEAEATAQTVWSADHTGWVGVTTYMDMHNNLRVKKETFVAMSGIDTTGTVREYPGSFGG